MLALIMETKVKYILVIVALSDGSAREVFISDEQRAQISDVLGQSDTVRVSHIDLSEVLEIDKSKLECSH